MIDMDIIRAQKGLPPLKSCPPPKLPKPGGSGGPSMAADNTMEKIRENIISAEKTEKNFRNNFFDLYRNYDEGEYDCSIDDIEQKMIETLKSWFVYHRKTVDLTCEKYDHAHKCKD